MTGKMIRDFCMAAEMSGFNIPVSIEIDQQSADELRKELRMMLKYGGTPNEMKHNECLFNGVVIIAPTNFSWISPQ